MSKLLRDWMPHEFEGSYMDTPTARLLDYEVIEEYSSGDAGFNTNFPFTQKNVFNWCVVSNGVKKYAVAWNENPTSRGWGFPMKFIGKVEKQ